MSRNILKSSLENASFTIIVQIAFRCLTFATNAFILRYVGRHILGIMNVRLLLLESTLLFLSREPFLRSCISNVNNRKWPQLINQIWLTVPVCMVLSIFFLYIWVYILPPVEDELASQYVMACYAIVISCIIELSAQPLLLTGQIFCFVKLKIVCEIISIGLRTIIFICIVLHNKKNALYAFSIAQVLCAVILLLCYLLYFNWYTKKLKQYRLIKKKNESLNNPQLDKYFENMDDFPFASVAQFLPGTLDNEGSIFNKDLLILTGSFAKQCIVKQILTEGEKYVMSISPVLSFSDQATYDIVNNLGSITARFIFKPIEDSGYFYFTQMVNRDDKLSMQDKIKVTESTEVLTQLCKVVSSIGLLVLVYGQSYAASLLLLYGGADFVEGGLPILLLRCHCLAIVLLAVNGVTECYSFATMTSKQLDKYNYYLLGFSVSFLTMSYVFTYLFGPVGFILANCLNMFVRICHSIHFIADRYKDVKQNPLYRIFPGAKFLTCLIVFGVILKISEEKLIPGQLLFHIIIGMICFAINLLVWGYENKSLIHAGYE
ncbi:protein RFT1 homolog, partial [Ctenocephalides felis]|uniref:protein RFT1 homolog n=1 Tax=Ctenocephalides felis TaxID=7515 RepID=UPI000E6E4C09